MIVTECTIQAILMQWCMSDKHHSLVVPNSTSIYSWESDLLSVTRCNFVHEYEIKLNMADYRRDALKESKHYYLKTERSKYLPNYFWYATFEFDIEPPVYAGWLKVVYSAKHFRYYIEIKKEAPRLHTFKLTNDKILAFGRLLAWRVTNEYSKRIFVNKGVD